jgi:hypothetical protein
MKLKASTFALIIAVVVALSASAFAAKKDGASTAKKVAVGTIASIDANQVVINKKVKGKDQPMTYKLDSSTQKTGNLAVGSPVTIQYRTDNNQMVATSVRERSTKSADTKPAKPSKKS